MKRLFATSALAALAVMAMALGSFTKLFESTYDIKAGSDLGKAKCSACHLSKMGGKLNPYGTDLKAAEGGTKKLTADALKKIEGKDSDGDGVKNGDELRAGKLPGSK